MKNYDPELHDKTEQLQVDLHNNFTLLMDGMDRRLKSAALERGVIIILLVVVLFIK